MPKPNKNIVFIGFMGSGKSSTSKFLAKTLRRKVFSTDQIIVKEQGRSIAQIFREEGEAYFRQLEKKTVAKLAKYKNVIIDCGGGIVLNPDNIKRLKKNGILVYLKTSPAWILKRVKKTGKRPLLNVNQPLKKIKELLRKRAALYNQADVTIRTDEKTPREVAREVYEQCQRLIK